IAAVGLICDALVVLLYALVHSLLPRWAPDLGAIVRDPGHYWVSHYSFLLWWVTGMLLAACVIGGILGAKWNAGFFSEMSGWWDIFNTAYKERVDKNLPAESLMAYCEMSDGSLVAGPIRSWNTDSRDFA